MPECSERENGDDGKRGELGIQLDARIFMIEESPDDMQPPVCAITWLCRGLVGLQINISVFIE